jgi:hypothetical protein
MKTQHLIRNQKIREEEEYGNLLSRLDHAAPEQRA